MLLFLGYQLWNLVRRNSLYRWEAAALAEKEDFVPRNFLIPQALRRVC
jgi:hypothetical protein